VRRLAVLISVLAFGAAVAGAQPAKVPRLVFPIVGQASLTDDFGDPRPQGPHEGNDIMAPRHAPAVAAEAGRVKPWIQRNAGCMLYLYGDSGTTYLYIHLNNDLGPGNDNRGRCVKGAFAPGIEEDTHVEAGQVIGFVGDSGDADGIHPHLHFEVHPDDGAATDPFPHLKRAQRLLFAATPGETVTLTLTGTVVAAAADAVQVRVQTLKVFPSGQTLKRVGKTLTLALPIATEASGTPVPTLVGRPALVLTEPVESTLDVALGKGLTAARLAPAPAAAGR
jgi:hypothetical protein